MSRTNEFAVDSRGWPLPPDGKYDIRSYCGEALEFLECATDDGLKMAAQSSAAKRIDKSRDKKGAHQKQELERMRSLIHRNRDRICAAYSSGASGIMLAREYVCDPKEIYVLLREHGVTIRPARNHLRDVTKKANHQ